MSLPSPKPLSSNQFALTQFSGCLSDVTINRKMVDFSSVSHTGQLEAGCPQTSQTSCTGCDSSSECIPLWNGSRCESADQDPFSFGGNSSYLIESGGSSSLFESISFELRTQQEKSLLISLSDIATIEVS